MASLTCGDYDIYVAARGGKPLVCRLSNAVSIQFNRVLNDFSEATVEVAVNSDCEACMKTINPWEHELLIFRGTELVWTGPILTLTFRPGQSRVKVTARDLLAWAEKRLIEIDGTDYEVEEVDIKQVFDWVLQHGYNKGPWGMTWSLSDTGIPITKFYPAYYSAGGDRWGGSYQVVAAELRALSQAGIDYTVINRHLYAGDLVVRPPVDTTLKIADHNWAVSPEIFINGTSMSTRTGVAGGQGGFYGWYDDQIWFERSQDQINKYGLLETIEARPDLGDEYTTVLPNAITQEAYARHQLLQKPVAFIGGGQLAGDAPFNFSTLIPGSKIEIGLVNSIRETETHYRIHTLAVNVSAQAEEITLQLSLPGVEDIRV